MKKLQLILESIVDDTIRKRGYLYYLKGAVSGLKYSSSQASAKVQDTSNYFVEIEFNGGKLPSAAYCSCAYNEKGVCKHIVAVLYQLNENNFFDTSNNNPEHFEMNEIGFGDVDYSSGNFLNRQDENNSRENTANGKTRKQWLKEIEQKKEAVQFEKFKNEITVLLKKENKKNASLNYCVAYSIQPKIYRTNLHVLRRKLKKDGSNAGTEIMHNSNFNNLPALSLQEKLIIDRIAKQNGEYSVDLNSSEEFGSGSKEHVNESNLFSDILSFLNDKEVYLYEDDLQFNKRIYIQKEEGSAGLLFNEEGDNISLTLQFEFQNRKFKSSAKIIPVLDYPLWILAEDKIFKVSNLSFGQFHNFFHNSNDITVPKVYLEYFEQNLLPQLSKNLPIESDKYSVEELTSPPVKRIYLDEEDTDLKLTLKFAYGEHEVSYDETESAASFFKEKKIYRIVRNKKVEEEARQEVKSFSVKEIENGIFISRGNPLGFLFDFLPAIKELGFEIFGENNLTKYKVNTSKPVFSFAVSSGIDWFDVSVSIRFDGTCISFETLLDSIKHKKEYVQLQDGSIGIIPQQWINKIKRALLVGEIIKKDDESEHVSLRFSNLQASSIELLTGDAEIETDEKYSEQIARLNSFENIRRQNVPLSFENVLRHYQKTGFDWLYFLKDYRFGGILADDMGLGKTIQVLALLLNEKEKGKELPDLVVAPTSVVFNWINEAERFSPSLRFLNHTGINRVKEDALHFENYDAVITSYQTLLRDIDLFAGRKFNYLILDESQKIKNPTSKTAKIMKTLDAEHRLCLTGTPVENNLLELWSQMSFLNPGMLGSLNKFQDAFVKPIQKENDEAASEYLRRIVYPFILRRKKEIVASELPEKTEIIQYCEMEPKQKEIYDIWKDSIRNEIISEIDKNGMKNSGFKVIEGLLRLRQICNHPSLVKNSYKGRSGKFEEFKEQLENILEENHKVLVFSQFVKMLEIIKAHLDAKNISYEYLTGSTIDREACVKNFQENESVKIFLISLKAGGFGLNLTAADYVLHYDPWWNPAVEAQATDRTHRIGQDKNVFVYKFITKDSVEEKILQLQEKKKELVENIITSESDALKNLTQEDVNILFS